MEYGFVFISKWSSFALKTRTNAIQIEIVATVIECGLFTIDVTPIGARLRLLIECRTVRAQKAKILYLRNRENKNSERKRKMEINFIEVAKRA